MRRAFAVFAASLLVGGCMETQQVQNGPTPEQQQFQAELDEIQSQIDQNLNDAKNAGQNALESAKPKWHAN